MDKKGQIGDAMVWIVGFIIIFFILTLFAFTSSIIASKKVINTYDFRNEIGTNEINIRGEVEKSSDIQTKRILSTFLMTRDYEGIRTLDNIIYHSVNVNLTNLKEQLKRISNQECLILSIEVAEIIKEINKDITIDNDNCNAKYSTMELEINGNFHRSEFSNGESNITLYRRER